ncbi:hypothetical protein B0F90DRAFT_1749968 [Multifurca ochricompacta]|uniref:Uncharacterized protein n=1 Tax=Multifurca ochricompacta TaxID=376703 RepID=A0AAD4LZE0_9AGAM|nr:hypothetical protein B0F90DRAFT_1749968 [Multifurca ochricompacta]
MMPAHVTHKPTYEFLAYPPSPRVRPTEPLPPTPGVTKSSISDWIARVIPGSPAPPNSASCLSFTDTPTPDAKVQSPDLHTHGYAYAIIPLPGLMRFLRPRPHPHSRSTTHTSPTTSPFTRTRKKTPRPSSPTSPTTQAFRIAHKKRAQYAQHGALPLPLDSEVALMQYVDGGSRANAARRLAGDAYYTDGAGVIYADEAEAGECLPLLLLATNEPSTALESAELDVMPPASAAFGGLPSALSGGFEFSPSAPPSPSGLAWSTPVEISPTTCIQSSFPSSHSALFSIPARARLGLGFGLGTIEGLGRGGDNPHPALGSSLSLPLPLARSAETVMTRSTPPCKKQRRRPTPLALSVPAQRAMIIGGFEDSFMPASHAPALHVGREEI